MTASQVVRIAPGRSVRRHAGFAPVLAAAVLLAARAGAAIAQEPAPPGPDALAAEIAALSPGARPRAALPWRTCVRTAFADARAAGKPVLVWAFRGDPGEERC